MSKKEVALFFVIIIWANICVAQTNERARYNLEPGSFVEGSQSHGGVQPDYYLDTESEEIRKLLKKAERIGDDFTDKWEVIERISNHIRNEVLMDDACDGRSYHRILAQARYEKRSIRLSEYIQAQAGVCREYAMVTHFALKAAGIPNEFVYAKVNFSNDVQQYSIVEDHAFLVIQDKGAEWVVDAYYRAFNGYRLKDLMSATGVTGEKFERSSTAIISKETRRILEINTYPKVWNRVEDQESSCELLFGTG